MLKRLLLPPLLPVVLLALFAVWTILDETLSAPPKVLAARLDNAPRNAAFILIFLAPIFYVLFGILNGIDSVFDRFSGSNAWAATGGICLLLSALLSTIFYRPEVDSSPIPGVGIATLTCLFFLVPMTLIRRRMLSPNKAAAMQIPHCSSSDGNTE